MKQLLLLRHAKSKWKGSAKHGSDHDRPLARRGVKDARTLGKLLAASDPKLDRVLCSSAVRARQTWELLEGRLGTGVEVQTQRSLYMPTREALLSHIAQLPKELQTVLIVGHNPSLEALALSLVKKGEPALRARLAEKFPTCTLCVLVWPGDTFQDVASAEVSLRTFVTPHEHAGPAPNVHPAPRKALPLVLPREPRVRDTAWLVFADALAQLRENVAGAHAGQEPEFAHQLRVGVRRLRTALRFFGPALDEARSAALREELTWLFRLLGAVRDYDVFLAEHVAPLSGQGELHVLYKACERERALHLTALQVALSSRRFSALLRELLDFETCIAQAETKDRKLKPYARTELRRRLRKVREQKAAVEADDAHALHELRKQVKRLRYTCEFVQAAFPARLARRFVKRLEGLQSVLGELNDAAEGKRLLTRSLPRNTPKNEKRRLREPVHTHLSELEAEALASFKQAWQKFERAEPFWR